MCEEQKKGSSRVLGSQWKEDLRRGRWRREKMAGPSIFISKTYEILENDSYSMIAGWNEEGTNFTIFDVEKFEQEILPVYFRHRNFSSFVRQLNMYDFHKIRNEQNKNIFEHRQFRRDAKHLLRNIKRKGCSNKKSSDTVEDPSYEQQTPFDQEDEFQEKQDNLRPTLAAIDNRSQISISKSQENPLKTQLLEDFIASLPDIVESEQEVKEIIRGMKRDTRYRCLNSKEDVKRVVQKIRRNKMKREKNDDLEELSIEEEIMVQNVDDREQRNPTMAILTSDNYLPPKTHNLICSLILFEEPNYKNH